MSDERTTDSAPEEFLSKARALAVERDCPNYVGGEFVFCLGHGPCKCMEDARAERKAP